MAEREWTLREILVWQGTPLTWICLGAAFVLTLVMLSMMLGALIARVRR